ncbi:MAG: virulence-associated protein E [Gammaproteobacteria bacterium]|nr:virulence-associated protein E [Gammaproteobacteria bacterium]
MTPQKSRPCSGAAYTAQQRHDTPINRILHRLEKVKRTAPDKWIALCPAHSDKRPSLSIKQADDGRVLLKCWTGCGAAEIVSALGLSLADLFAGDRRSLSDHGTGPMRRPFDWRDALQGISHEATVTRLIVSAINRGDDVDADALDRLALAEQRIDDALTAVGGER